MDVRQESARVRGEVEPMAAKSRTRDGLFRRGGMWYCRKDPITGRQVSTGCRDLAAAKRWRSERERIANSPADIAASTQRFSEWVTVMLASKRHQGGEKRADYYAKTLGPWARIVGVDILMADVTPALVDRYVAERRSEHVKDHTISKEFTAVVQVLKAAKRGGAYPGDIAALRPLDLHQSYVPRERALSPVELRALIRALPAERAAFVIVAAMLGLRRGEVFALLPEDIDLQAGTVFVRGTKTEESEATLPILKAFRPYVEMLIPYLPVAPWASARRDLQTACRRAGIERCTPNDLRRTYCTALVAAGVSLDTARRLMRHASTAMVQRVYGRPTPDALASLVEETGLMGPEPVEGLGPTLWELAEERHQGHIDRVAGTKKRALKPVLDAAVTRQSGSVSRRPKGIEPKTSAPDTIRTCDLSLRKPRAELAFLGNAEHPAHCSVPKSPEESRATVTDAAVTRHRPQAWSLAYAYRDALSRGAAA